MGLSSPGNAFSLLITSGTSPASKWENPLVAHGRNDSPGVKFFPSPMVVSLPSPT